MGWSLPSCTTSWLCHKASHLSWPSIRRMLRWCHSCLETSQSWRSVCRGDSWRKNIWRWQLVKVDATNKALWVNHSAVDVGFGAESVLKVLRRKDKVSSRAILEYNNDCMDGLSKMVKKILDKSPLKYPLVHDMASLDPGLMYKEPEACLTKMKSLVHRLIHAKQLAGGITTWDAVIQQYTAKAACWRHYNGRCSHPAVHCSPRLIHAKQLAGGITTGDAVIQQYTALLDEDTRSSLLEVSQREMQSSSSTLHS